MKGRLGTKTKSRVKSRTESSLYESFKFLIFPRLFSPITMDNHLKKFHDKSEFEMKQKFNRFENSLIKN